MDHPYQSNEFIKLEPADYVTYGVEEALPATSYIVTSQMSRVTEPKKEPADYVMYGVEEASSKTSYIVASQLPRAAETKVKQEIKPDPFVTQIKTETNPYSEDTKIKLEPTEETDTNEDINIKLEPFIANEINVKNETDISSAPKRSDCPICRYGCTHKGKFKKHKKMRMYVCDICKFKRMTKRKLNAHIFNTHAENYKCVHGVQCKFQTSDEYLFKKHRKAHKGTVFVCQVCNFRTLKINELLINKHMRKHNSDKIFKCDICEYKALRKRNYMRHMDKHKLIDLVSGEHKIYFENT